ncbi:MAG: hypothetical protein E6Y86_02325 [Slackia sp.]|uniref:hypothetical protein n=1 Tax=uncultured Slackia sp. TaxID=665903 RepID=UPI002803ADB0|nr:hypothetical protein [uncultured Slackia sp.]MDU6010870.1 hypothetical protein [Slackia sp.]
MLDVVSLVQTLVVVVAVSATLSMLYSFGIRLWSQGLLDAEGNAHLMHRIGAVLCFMGCVAIVLFALWVMIPAFH